MFRYAAIFVLLLCILPASNAQLPATRTESPPLTREALQRKQAEDLVRDAKTLYGVAVLRQHGDRLLEAMKLLEKAAKLDPESAEPARALIPLYLGLGRDEDALAACAQVLQRDPADCDTAYDYAKLLKASAQFRRAAEVLARSLESKSLAARPELMYATLRLRCELLEKLEDDEVAAANLKRLADHLIQERKQLVNHGLVELEDYPVTLARIYERAGMCFVRRALYREATEIFQKARDYLLDQPDATTRLKAVRFNWQLSEVEFAQGRYDEALRYLNAYLQHYPIHPDAFERKITLLRKLNRADEIIPHLRIAAKNMPKTESVQLMLARELTRDRERRFRIEADLLYQDLAERFGTEEVYRGWFQLLRLDNRMVKVLDLIDETYRTIHAKEDVEIEVRERAAARARAMLTVLRSDAALVGALLPESLKELSRNRRREVHTWQLLAILAAKTGQLEQAATLFRNCLKNVPVELEYSVYSGLILVLHQAHKFEAIEKLCRDAIARKLEGIKQFYFHYQLANALSDQGRNDEAIREAENAVKLGPDKKIPQRRLLATLLAQAGKYDLALAECQAMMKEFTSAEDIRQVRYALAMVYQIQGDHARSEGEYRRILAEDPNDPEANNNLGYHLAERNQKLDEAEQLIRRAIEADSRQRKLQADDEPENSSYLDSLAWVLFRKGKYDQARDLLERVIQMDRGTDSAEVWDHLGDVYARLKQPAKAKQAWQNALKFFEYDRRAKKEGRPAATEKKIKQLSVDP